MVVIENNLALRFFYSGIFVVLFCERMKNTFFKQQVKKKSIKVFHEKYFYGLLSSYLLIVLASFTSYLVLRSINFIYSIVGLLVYVMGAYLRRSAIKTLNEYWSVNIEIKENQKYFKEGIYGFMKHPYYFGVLLELSGFALFCNSILGFIFTYLLQLPLLLIRIHYEERILKVYSRRLGF